MSISVSDLRLRQFPVLDDGFVALVDVMGDDSAIVQAARVSFGEGTRTVSDDRTLIRYLMRNWHTTPFEMAELKFLVRCPMDCWRQWIRHRTASVNEYSTRYSEAIDSAQRTPPDGWRLQATANKQGSAGTVAEWPDHEALRAVWGDDFDPEAMEDYPTPGDWLSSQERLEQEQMRRIYEERLAFGVAREQARKDLPLSTYTQAYWKIDLHNLFHFLRLRMDSHAQTEIRAYATVIGREIVRPLFPLAWAAFVDYRLEAISFSARDIAVARMVATAKLGFDDACNGVIGNARERDECRAKLARLGLI